MSKDYKISDSLAEIRKHYGPGAIMRFGDKPEQQIDTISTRCLSLDMALGVGGLPRGRMVEIYGPESSGKTTLALQVIAEAQSQGGLVAFIDAEYALDPTYAADLGVNVDDMLISQPSSAEEAFNIIESLVRTNEVSVIVLDSVAALAPEAELRGESGDSHVGLAPRLMSQACRKLKGIVSTSNTCLIFINQIRDKIGVMFGSPETTTGGKALRFYASMRIDIRRIAQIKDSSDLPIGNRTRVKVVKNKLARPFTTCEFDLMYGEGISREGDLLDLALAHNIVDQKGSWFSWGDEKLGQGKENVRGLLKSNKVLYNEIEEQVKSTIAQNN